MYDAKSNGKNLLSLNSTDLEVLTGIASSSFGDYTSILRVWLAINYQICIYPPDNNNLKKEKVSYYSESSLGLEIVSSKTNSNCIFINSKNKNNYIFDVEIFDSSGKEMLSNRFDVRNRSCLEHSLSPGIYIARIKDLSSSSSRTIKILIQ